MKAATIHDLKKELSKKSVKELTELCLRLARFKKENKELLSFLLLEEDLSDYLQEVKDEMTSLFKEINKSNGLYIIKKSIRKILRIANKHIRYTGEAQAEVELLLHFCTKLKASGIPFHKSNVLQNLYDRQVERIIKAIKSLHEDLQSDYSELVSSL